LMGAGGLLALYVDKPEMFVGMASMFLPGFNELDLANQKQPVKIPASLTRLEGVDVYALMSKNAIGTVIGQQNPADLSAFLDAKPQNTGTLFSMSIDMEKQMQIEDAFIEQWDQYGFDMDDFDAIDDVGDMDEKDSQVIIFSDTVRAAYAAMLDRSRFNVSLNEDGVSFENRMTFK